MITLRPELMQAAHVLGRALRNMPALRTYAEASAKLEADAAATHLLAELQRVQADIRTCQSNGGVTQEDLTRLRELQYQVQTHPTIAVFVEAQQNVMVFLPEVNQEISQLLGIDFAALGRVSERC